MLYYILLIGATMLNTINNVCLYKKYQTTAGTGLWANIIYMIINGIVSAILPGAVLIFTNGSLQTTLYSVLFATATVVSAALALICMLKVYEQGQIAVINLLVTVGGIVFPSLWGIFVWKEEISLQKYLAIILMLGAIFLMIDRKGEKSNKKLTWLYIVIILCNCLVTLLGKQHQIEQVYETVDTLSFSIWVGIIRVLLFTCLGAVYFFVNKVTPRCQGGLNKTIRYATFSSITSGGSYILTLFMAIGLPIVIATSLGAGIAIVMGLLLTWLIYREKLTVKQWVGVLLSFVGVILFLNA